MTLLYFNNNAENHMFIIENNKARGNEYLFGIHVQKHKKTRKKKLLVQIPT